MYTNGEPTGDVKDYLDWVLSDEGQCIISKKGLRARDGRNLRVSR